jgi:purine-binding chemotaxis protein CheW
MADRTRDTRVTWVGLEVGGVSYALNIQYVREIIRPLPMQVLPHASETVVGVVDHRGDVVPIVDLRVRFSTQDRMPLANTRWVICNRNGRLVRLVVDRVSEVFTLNESDARPVPDIGQGAERRGITAAYSHGGRLVFTLDVERLTQTDEGPMPPLVLATASEGI